MSNAAELREALDKGLRYPTDMALIEGAARTIALPILEADPELVERIKPVIWEHLGPMPRDVLTRFVAALLAAISNPTPVAGESL